MHCHNLLCTLCNLEFSVKQEWNDHLLTSSHQQLARGECESLWFTDESIRSSCVILFSSCPMSIEFAKEIIQCFGNKFAGRFVTDFVWWRENPTFAVLQFESRFVADNVLKENPNRDVVLTGKLLQIKSLNQILSLQWKQLIHFVSTDPLESSPSPTPGFKRKKLEEFNWIRSRTEISRENWRSFSVILKQVTKLLNCPGPFVFRNYLQQIPFQGSGIPLVFICATENGKFKPLETYKEKELLVLHNKVTKFLDQPPKQIKIAPGLCFKLKGENHNFRISFVTDFRHIREVQMARLLDYLCEFDSRLNGVLLLIAFWSKVRIVQFTNPTKPGNGNPTILQWLVVLFLTIEGLLPSVKYIQDNLQPSVFFENTCANYAPAWIPGEFTASEIALARDWKGSKSQPQKDTEGWIESVTALTQQMFEFYSKKVKIGKWVLDTHNGKVIPQTDVPVGNDLELKDIIRMIHPLIPTETLVFSTKTIQDHPKTSRKKMRQAAERMQKWNAGHEEMKLCDAIGKGPGRTKILDWQRDWKCVYELGRT